MTDELVETKAETKFLQSINQANELLVQVAEADDFNMRTVTKNVKVFFESKDGKTLMEQVNETSRRFLGGGSMNEMVEKIREKTIADTMQGKLSTTSMFGENGVLLEAYQRLSKAIGEEPLSAEDKALKKFADNYALYQVRPFFFANTPMLVT